MLKFKRVFVQSFFLLIVSLYISLFSTGLKSGNNGLIMKVQAKTVISLSETKAELDVGKVKKIKLKKGKKNISWKKVSFKSSKKKIAKVSKYGNITARKKGKVNISAIYKKKTYICKVTVIEDTETVVSSETTEENTNSSSSEIKLNTLSVDKTALSEVHTGQATWYGTDTSNGYIAGCAGLQSLTKSEKIDNGDTPLYVCALNKTDFYAGLQGAYLRVTAANGKSVDVMVTDLLPNVTPGYIDLDRKAFSVLSPLSTGRLDISWKIIKYPTKKPIEYLFKNDSTKYWAQVQVRNQSLPVVKFEYKKKGAADSTYKTLTKTYYNYYTMTSPGEGPYTFRATDILGNTLVDDIALTPTGLPVSGKSNF